MATIREWMDRLIDSVRARRRDAELEEELRLHLQLAAEREEHSGSSPANARRAGSRPIRWYRTNDGGPPRSARVSVARQRVALRC